MSVKVEQITDPLVLGEGPHWDAGQQALYFVSIQEHTIHKYVPATRTHTRTKLGGRVGFIVPVQGTTDQFVVGVERSIQVVEWSGADGAPARLLTTLAEVDGDHPTNRINDGKADPRGRLFAGTMGHEEPPGTFQMGRGALYRVDARGALGVCAPVHLSNGLAWDERRRAMYYIDSLDYRVRRYDYDADTGELANMTCVYDFKKSGEKGVPDGMAIDAAGRLWVASFGGGCVLQLEPAAGAVLRRVPVPARQVTSCAFGGPALDVLYVTTASMPVGGEQPPPGGATFAVTGLGVEGLPGVGFALPHP